MREQRFSFLFSNGKKSSQLNSQRISPADAVFDEAAKANRHFATAISNYYGFLNELWKVTNSETRKLWHEAFRLLSFSHT
jgi:hypothetical protein